MLERIHVTNYQSLHDVSLDLGKFTVVLGDSSAGKTAFIRALHALAFNIRGNSHITHGKKISTVTGVLENWIVELQAGGNVYTVTDRRSGIQLDPFGKLNGSVPEKVQEILGVTPTNFAGQFDPPFLITDSGAHVAKVLGEITNVNIIFEAVASGNKKRKNFGIELSTRKADLEAAQKEMAEFLDLPSQLARMDRVESLADDVERLAARVVSLETQVVDLRDAEGVLARTPEYPAAPDTAEVERLVERRYQLSGMMGELATAQYDLQNVREYPDVPDVAEIQEILERRRQLALITDQLVNALTDLTAAKMDWNEADTLEAHYEREIHTLLVEAGTCPTCNQRVS